MRFVQRPDARLSALLLTLALAFAAARAMGADAPPPDAPPPPPQISGVLWADYFYIANGASEDSSAFTIRRVHLTLDQKLDERFSARVQLEADGQAVASNGRMTMWLKQAFLRWNDAVPHGAVLMGISISPLWFNEEQLWGYRCLEKTPLDLRGLGNATEFGVALNGATGAEDLVNYHVMMSNGSGQRPENNRSPRLTASVAFRHKGFMLEPVADWEGATGDNDNSTVKLTAGWSDDRRAVGIEGFMRRSGGPGAEPQGVSVFGHAALGPRLVGVARWDAYDPDSASPSTGYRSQYFVFGLDLALSKRVHILPNVIAELYHPRAASVPNRDSDVTPRITLACTLP